MGLKYMICKYVFDTDGFLTISDNQPIIINEFTVNFIIENTCKRIEVSFASNDSSTWPKIIEMPREDIKAHLYFSSPRYEEIKEYIKVIEGLLSFWGITQVKIENPEIIWVPQSEDEKRSLKIFSYKRNKAESDTSVLKAVPFDIIARSVLAAPIAYRIEIPLNFYRRAFNDIHDEQYIEAIYNYYFFLEGIYANGQYKSNLVQKEFEKSELLRESIRQALVDFNPMGIYRDKMLNEFAIKFKDKSPNQIIDYIIRLRGFLHHQNILRKDIWHPDDNIRFITDAILLSDICYIVAFHIAKEYVFSEEILQKYKEQFFVNGKPKWLQK